MLKKKGEPLVLLPARALKQSIQHQTHSVTDPLSQRSSLTRGPRPIHSLKRPLEIGSAMYMKEDIPSQSKKSSACRCVFFYVHCINVHCVRVCVCACMCACVCAWSSGIRSGLEQTSGVVVITLSTGTRRLGRVNVCVIVCVFCVRVFVCVCVCVCVSPWVGCLSVHIKSNFVRLHSQCTVYPRIASCLFLRSSGTRPPRSGY